MAKCEIIQTKEIVKTTQDVKKIILELDEDEAAMIFAMVGNVSSCGPKRDICSRVFWALFNKASEKFQYCFTQTFKFNNEDI